MIDFDAGSELQNLVLKAKVENTTLQIQGGGSKHFYGRQPQGIPLDVTRHQGIVNYQPSELVITARAGTRIIDLQGVLAEQGQMLAFEPAGFNGQATLGGAIAWGLSGPRRPFSGAARDFVLGCRIINGNGEILKFGGEVMKNVAGYDVSRLMVGAMGTLGVLLEVSLKVLPLPEVEQTVAYEMNLENAIREMNAMSSQCLPVSGLCFDMTRMYMRLSGSENAVHSAMKKLGGEICPDAFSFWRDIAEYSHHFFNQPGKIWRLSVPPATPELPITGRVFYDWGGALRWINTEASADSVFSTAIQNHGHAGLFRSERNAQVCFQPLPEALQQLHYRLKQAFDPEGLFNPFRMYQAW